MRFLNEKNFYFNFFLLKRQELISKQTVQFHVFSDRKFVFVRPFLELFLQYLDEFYKEDVKISQKLAKITDLRGPHNLYPEARQMKRKFIYHHGPTNSGKTYSALLDLEKVESGIYCAPLRLLAWEVTS